MKKTQVFLATLLTLAVAAIVIVALVMANRIQNQDRFSVTGSGTVYAKADIANIEVGLKVEAKKTAALATTESTNKMNEIVTELKALGMEEKDIKTSNYSLRPVYRYSESRGQELIGYEVTQNLTLKIRDLNKIGDVIAKTTEKGANQIGNVNFTIDDEFQLKNEAREIAINKAKEKAELIAAQSGMKLGDIKSVYESMEPITPIAYNYSNARKEMAVDEAGGISAPEILSGQNEVRVEVTLVYEIK